MVHLMFVKLKVEAVMIVHPVNKNVKNERAETRSFWFLQITQDLNYYLLLLLLLVGNVCKISAKHNKFYGRWSSP